MYFQLTEAIKRRMIIELRRYWKDHPKYQDLVDNIQGKFSFRERPQHGIIVKTGSASTVALANDNYMGTTYSYVSLLKVENYFGQAIEWVREDAAAIRRNNGVFPTAAGIYYIELTEDNEFYVDPLLDIRNERVTKVTDTEFQLQNAALNGTLRLYLHPSNLPLYETTNYTLDASAGTITLNEPLGEGLSLVADYRTPQASLGPFYIKENHARHDVIEGVILAFGRRCKKGDRLGVIISPYREPTALEYGGRWDLSLDFDIVARDVYAQQEIADRTVFWLWGVARSWFLREGIEVSEVSLGGESEEVYDETGDDYYYTSSFSMSISTDWSISVPINKTIRRLIPESLETNKQASTMTDGELASQQLPSKLQMVESIGRILEDPYFTGKNWSYETIK